MTPEQVADAPNLTTVVIGHPANGRVATKVRGVWRLAHTMDAPTQDDFDMAVVVAGPMLAPVAISTRPGGRSFTTVPAAADRIVIEEIEDEVFTGVKTEGETSE